MSYISYLSFYNRRIHHLPNSKENIEKWKNCWWNRDLRNYCLKPLNILEINEMKDGLEKNNESRIAFHKVLWNLKDLGKEIHDLFVKCMNDIILKYEKNWPSNGYGLMEFKNVKNIIEYYFNNIDWMVYITHTDLQNIFSLGDKNMVKDIITLLYRVEKYLISINYKPQQFN